MEEIYSPGAEPKEEKNLPFLTNPDLNNLPAKLYTFSKKEHLKSFSLIKSLFSSGKRIADYPVVLIWKKLDPESAEVPALVGFSVPKKYFKKAVDRNTIKRRMRESYRLYKNKLFSSRTDNTLALMFIYSSSEEITFQQLNNKLISCCERLFVELNESN